MKKFIDLIIIALLLFTLLPFLTVSAQQKYETEKEVLEEAVEVIQRPTYNFDSFQNNVYKYIRTQLPGIRSDLGNIKFEVLHLYMGILMDAKATSSHVDKIREVKKQAEEVENEILKYERMIEFLNLMRPQFKEMGFIDKYPKDEELYFVGRDFLPKEKYSVLTKKELSSKIDRIVCTEAAAWFDSLEEGQHIRDELPREVASDLIDGEGYEVVDGVNACTSLEYLRENKIKNCEMRDAGEFKNGYFQGKTYINKDCKVIMNDGIKNTQEEIKSFIEKMEMI